MLLPNCYADLACRSYLRLNRTQYGIWLWRRAYVALCRAPLQKHTVINAKSRSELLSRKHTDRPCTLLHGGEVRPGNPAQLRELLHGKSGVITIGPKHSSRVRRRIPLLPPIGSSDVYRIVLRSYLGRRIELTNTLDQKLFANAANGSPNTGLFHDYQHNPPRFLTFPSWNANKQPSLDANDSDAFLLQALNNS